MFERQIWKKKKILRFVLLHSKTYLWLDPTTAPLKKHFTVHDRGWK